MRRLDDVSVLWSAGSLPLRDHENEQRTRLLRVPEDLVTARRQHRAAAAVSPAALFRLKERETTSAKTIANLKKQIAALEAESRGRNSAKDGGAFALSEEVTRLLAGDFDSDDVEELMVAMHRKMASGDIDLVYELEAVAAGKLAPRDAIDTRCLALETLATARLPQLESRLYLLIRFCLASGQEGLEFGAIGAADLLPLSMRLELRSAVRAAIKGSPRKSSTRRLGALFLETNR